MMYKNRGTPEGYYPKNGLTSKVKNREKQIKRTLQHIIMLINNIST